MKMKMKMDNRGLLSLGLIFSLGLTLTGFEYISSDTKYTKKRMAKAEFTEDETVFIPEIQKPEIPRPEVPNKNPMTQPSPIQPINPVGPIIVSPIAPVDPINPVWEPGVDPIDPNIGTQQIVCDFPIDVYSLEEFPTYEEFLTIKNKDERFNSTTSSLVNRVKSNVRYTEIAKELNIQGIVYAEFVIDKMGNISDVKIIKGLHESLDDQVIKSVKKLPKMIPGKQRDIPVNVRYVIPVKFELK